VCDRNLVSAIADAVVDLEPQRAEDLIRQALDQGVDPLEIINDGIARGLQRVGEKFEQGEYFLAELTMAGQFSKKLIDLVAAHIPRDRVVAKKRVVIGTVKGDLHDIGKNLVAQMLTCAGYEVLDLGKDVPTMEFISKVREFKPDVLGLSALMQTTRPNQAEVIQYLRDLGLRDAAKVVVGGGATTEEFAASIGADGWAPDAVKAVEVIDRLLGVRR
jgi:5-methyltetrahydrofolate--homocysteine methyltransferase